MCHCSDCKRVTGSPAPTFAAFDANDISLEPERAPAKPVNAGVTRWFCPDCGSQLMATFDYLPGQAYVPVGILDQIDALEPDIHCHAESAVPWLHLPDAPRVEGAARANLRQG